MSSEADGPALSSSSSLPLSDSLVPPSPSPSSSLRPFQPIQWVQCEECQKWRRVPLSLQMDALPDRWHCGLNTWDGRNRCEVEEEEEEEEEEEGERQKVKSEELWPGLPPEWLFTRERGDFYSALSSHFATRSTPLLYPSLCNAPVDLFRLYSLINNPPFNGRDHMSRSSEGWLPLCSALALPSTTSIAMKVRALYDKFIEPVVQRKLEQGVVLSHDSKDTIGSLSLTDKPKPKQQMDERGEDEQGNRKRKEKFRKAIWSPEEDAALRLAIAEEGTGKWAKILETDKWAPLLRNKTAAELRARWRGWVNNRRGTAPSAESIAYQEAIANAQYRQSHPFHAPTAHWLRRPYPIKLFEMRIHAENNRLPGELLDPVDDSESDAEVEAEADMESEDEHADTPIEQVFYRTHRTKRLNLSEDVSIPLNVLRRYMEQVLKLSSPATLKLLKELAEEPNEQARALHLSLAIYRHMLTIDRKPWLSSMQAMSTQAVRADRKRRFDATLKAYRQAKQIAVEADDAMERNRLARLERPCVFEWDQEHLQRQPWEVDDDGVKAMKDSTTTSGVHASLEPSNVLPNHVQTASSQAPAPKRVYRLPGEFPLESNQMLTHSLNSGIPVFPANNHSDSIKYSQLSLASSLSDISSSRVSFDNRAKLASAGKLKFASQNDAIKASREFKGKEDKLKIEKLKAKEDKLLTPLVKAFSNKSSVKTPAPLRRGPYLTLRKKAALELARDQLQARIAAGQVAIDTSANPDDSSSLSPLAKHVFDNLPEGKIFDYLPKGAKVSQLLSMISSGEFVEH